VTRMWMVEPEVLCNQHLLGEHKEVHQANGTLKKEMSITGYIKNNCIEPKSIQSRHDVLAGELIRRKMNHKSPLEAVSISYLSKGEQKSKINVDWNLHELMQRCPKCKERIVNHLFKKYQVMIERRAYSWMYAKNCRTNVCLSYEDLIAMGYEVFVNCIKDWKWQRASFSTLLYTALNNKYHMENDYKKIKTSEISHEIRSKSYDIEKQVEFKIKLESLSPNAKYVINSVLNTPLDLINQSKKETGRVSICKKRLQRYLIEHKSWSIYSCIKTFEEIKEVLKY